MKKLRRKMIIMMKKEKSQKAERERVYHTFTDVTFSDAAPAVLRFSLVIERLRVQEKSFHSRQRERDSVKPQYYVFCETRNVWRVCETTRSLSNYIDYIHMLKTKKNCKVVFFAAIFQQSNRGQR